MPLDIEAPDLAAGRRVIVQGTATFDGHSSGVPFAVTKTIAGVRGRTVQWGNLVGASTVLTLDSLLIANPSVQHEKADIRELRFHEITSPRLTLAPLTGFAGGAFANGSNALYFFGTAADAKVAGRAAALPLARRWPQRRGGVHQRRVVVQLELAGAAHVAAVVRPRARAVHED